MQSHSLAAGCMSVQVMFDLDLGLSLPELFHFLTMDLPPQLIRPLHYLAVRRPIGIYLQRACPAVS